MQPEQCHNCACEKSAGGKPCQTASARRADWRTVFNGHPTNGLTGGLIIQIDKVKP
jgi:hypothetical protein